MRKGLLYAGVALLLVGVATFVFAAVGVGQASAAFLNCMNSGNPTFPGFGFPTACTDAMGAIATYQGLELLGGVLGLFGFVLFILGIALQPERPMAMPLYPPPVYAPPYGVPPQGPQPPPPQP